MNANENMIFSKSYLEWGTLKQVLHWTYNIDIHKIFQGKKHGSDGPYGRL